VNDSLLEELLPSGWSSLQLWRSGGPAVSGVDAVGGPPYGHGPDEAGTRWRPGCGPNGLSVVLVGVFSNLVGEAADETGSLGQVVAPSWMVSESCWNAGKPGQRSWLG
jgi:hypothetical protein